MRSQLNRPAAAREDFQTPAYSLRALARLLTYPDAELRQKLPQLLQAVQLERGLQAVRLEGIERLIRYLQATDAYEIEAEYVNLFDSGRSTSLNLFEHVHGDSRDRGQAMVDLVKTYERSGLILQIEQGGELPDYLPLVLEYVSILDGAESQEFTADFAHILNALYAALLKRRSLYAHLPAAVLELMGHAIKPTEIAEDEALDEAWQEPAAFNGCSHHGQASAAVAQPIQIVRKPADVLSRGALA